MKHLDCKILLASQSPRRKQLISDLGFDYEVIFQDIEESYPSTIDLEAVPTFLACKKAMAITHKPTKREVILSADTIVLVKNEILPKPADAQEAKAFLRKLSGTSHKVITGVCLRTAEKEISFSDTALVHFASLSEVEIEYYVQKFNPIDKAGAYGIQEWIGAACISKIEGNYNTIVGLPTHAVYRNLLKLFKAN